jgi:chromosome segregation ATPase
MAIKSTVELEVKSNLKGFKGEIRQATIEAQEAVRTFGEFSPEAVEAEKRLAQLRDRMEDFNDRVSAVNPDKFAQVQTIVQGVARGFQAAQGAMALFGSESEDLQKTMVKLQGAMALADGLEGLGKIQQQFTAIAKNIKGTVVQAFKNLGQMTSLAFGGLLIILPIVIANFDKIKNAVMSLVPGLKTFASFIGGLVQRFTDFVGITSASERALEKYNKATEKNNEQLDREIALLKARGDEIGAFIKQREKLENELAQARANYGKNKEKEWGKIIDDSKNALAILTEDEKKYNKDRAKESSDRAKERRNEIRTLTQELRMLQADEANKEILALQQWYANARKQYAENQEALLVLENIYNYKRQELRDKELKDVRKGIATKEKEEKNLGENLVKIDEGTYRKKYSNQEKFAIAVKAYNEELVDLAKDFFDVSIELANAFARQDEESQKRAFNFSKAMKIASTIMSTIEGVQNAYKTAQDSPITAFIPAYPYIQAGLAGAFGLAQVAKLKATKFNSQQASQANGGGMPQMSAPQTSSSLLQQGGNEQLTQQQRVYVLEGDITRTQQQVSNNKKVSIVK